MAKLHDIEIAFLHDCTRFGPTNPTDKIAIELEKRGYIEWAFEGAALQGRWRLTSKGRETHQQEG